MKKFFMSALIALSLITIPTKNSEAAVGLIAGPAVTTVGALVTLTSGVGFALGETILNSWDLTIISVYMILPVGLLLLDGEQTVAFSEVNSTMTHLKSVSADEIETYNAELDQLNAINEQISAEVAADKNTDAKARWTDMSALVSPATLKIAGMNGALLMEKLKQ
jgi:hypothetical protein